MKLVVLLGPGAVGKMTVGQELMKITDLRLHHGHMEIEPIMEIFGYFHPAANIAARKAIFTEFAKTDEYGLITTFMCNFDQPFSLIALFELIEIFEKVDAEIYCVELVAEQETRLARNATENRLSQKASKRDLEWSSERIRYEDKNYRLQSKKGELPFENYMKIDNTNLEPQTVAQMIKEKFEL